MITEYSKSLTTALNQLTLDLFTVTFSIMASTSFLLVAAKRLLCTS